MRFTFFAAVVAACNFITTPQASGLTQHQPQLFDEPATYFAQITASEKKDASAKKDGPVKKEQTKGQDKVPPVTVPKKPEAPQGAKKDGPAKKAPPKKEGDAQSKKEAPKAEKKQEKAPTKKEDAGPQPKSQA